MKKCWNCGGKRRKVYQLHLALYEIDPPTFNETAPLKQKNLDNVCKRCANLILTLPNKDAHP